MEETIVGVAGIAFRIISVILGEILFWTICYWIGWPICKLVTWGKYPSSTQALYVDELHSKKQSGFWCCAVGLLVLITALIGAIVFFGA